MKNHAQQNKPSLTDSSPGPQNFADLLPPPNPMARRSFLRSLGVGAALMTPLVSGLTGVARAADFGRGSAPNALNSGDVAILRFLAAAELLEADLWQQYSELANGNDAYMEALEAIDDEFPQYVADNTDDEVSHAAFLNAFLSSMGADPVNLDAFRTLPSSQATGAQQIGRLTNLSSLKVDTSWWIRYRSPMNPDFGATFPQFIKILNRPTIPFVDIEGKEIQAIANSAAFHFGSIEQGGSSLYTSMAEKASDLTVLRIITSIGGVEVFHFAIWEDGAGNVPEVHIPGLTFPDIEEEFEDDPLRAKALVMPEPCTFIDPSLPVCSVIRPSSPENAGAMAAVTALTRSGLFNGQSQEFFEAVKGLAQAADAAQRVC